MMSSNHPRVHLSDIDEDRFGVRTARATNITLNALPSVLDFCHAHGVVLLIARCLDSELRAAQAMEREGFLLMDTLVHYVRDLVKISIPPDVRHVRVRPVRPGEQEDVKQIAAQSFRGYFGHYHADERLDRTLCDEVYVSWASRSCVSPEVADEVLVASLEDVIVGFLTLHLSTPEDGRGLLYAVAPSAQGKGVSSALMISGMKWCVSEGATRMLIRTQITNTAAQKVWTRLGFEPSHACYTFHKWFDRP